MKRNPNGYGTVTKLSGNRYKPYAAYCPIKNENGKPKREIIGYYETEIEARNALADYNRNRGTKINYTFGELWEDWSNRGLKKVDKSTADNYRAAWKHLKQLESIKAKELRTGHFQDIVDNLAENGLSESSVKKVIVTAKILEKYAMQYDIIQKNYADFVIMPECKKPMQKEIFTDEQILKLEQAAENDFMASRLIVCLIYSGWRISEFLNLTVQDYTETENAFIGGLKTDNGKNRIVPVHHGIQKYIDEYLQKAPFNPKGKLFCYQNKYKKNVPITADYFRKHLFSQTLEALGIETQNGSAEFTPHITRHTFATLAERFNVAPIYYKKILGHSQQGITEKVYIHLQTVQLTEAINQIKTQTELQAESKDKQKAG